MGRGWAAFVYIAGGAVSGVVGVVIVGYALVPLLGLALMSIVTRGAFLFLAEGDRVFDVVVFPLLFVVLGAAVACGGLAMLLHGIAVGWRTESESSTR